ncbi:hypothetical protein ANN_21288 [Periplaneta americana]|uniref:Uncharacterized protein n=1 Tax=Periplaneta americana TaxID=6978 RepID=A0ABQ8SFR2_PERAM|nr:hypothetical protein ANN_21288 [Periplaneta americana]
MKPFLLTTECLEKVNNSTIAQLFNSLQLLWPEEIQYDNVLLFISGAAPYMKKAGITLKVLFPNMLHDEASLIVAAKKLLNSSEVKNDLTFITAEFGFLPQVICQLQERGQPLTKSVKIVDDTVQRMDSVPGKRGSLRLVTFSAIPYKPLNSSPLIILGFAVARSFYGREKQGGYNNIIREVHAPYPFQRSAFYPSLQAPGVYQATRCGQDLALSETEAGWPTYQRWLIRKSLALRAPGAYLATRPWNWRQEPIYRLYQRLRQYDPHVSVGFTNATQATCCTWTFIAYKGEQ